MKNKNENRNRNKNADVKREPATDSRSKLQICNLCVSHSYIMTRKIQIARIQYF